VLSPHENDAILLAHRQRLQQNRAVDRRDRRRRADPNGEHERDEQIEAGPPLQRAHSVGGVLLQLLDHASA
jgi:hypothetical protein